MDRIPSWVYFSRASDAESRGSTLLARRIRAKADAALEAELRASLVDETRVPQLDTSTDEVDQ